MPRCRMLLPLLTLVGALAGPAAANASVTEFDTNLTAGSAPHGITSGPDGNVWFTARANPGGIGRITPDGTITEYRAGATSNFSSGQRPTDIVTGPDGALWLTMAGGYIGRFDPASGLFTQFNGGMIVGEPTSITRGPDDNLWFTERAGTGAIARITPGGLITEFTAGLTPNSAPTDIVAGSDGNLWFTENADPGRIGRIDPHDGTITEFSAGLSPNSGPNHIVAASNGKLYFTQNSNPGRIGRIKTDGKIHEYVSGLTADSAPGDIAEGGDGALWFTAGANPGRLGRLWPDSEQISEFTGGVTAGLSANAVPTGLTKGPDGNVWFTEGGSTSRIGRITVPPLAEIDTPKALGGGKVRLTAKVAPNSQTTTYAFEWGHTADYSEQTDDLSAAAVAGPIDVSADVELAPDARYHVRVKATNPSGTTVSEDKNFYVTEGGEIVKEKPVTTPPPSTSTVILSDLPPLGTPALATDPAPERPAGGLLSPGAPVLGQIVGVRPLSGSVRIRTPGASDFVPLATGARVPVGSLIDARHGRVVLHSALDHSGRSQKGTFWGAVFEVRQRRGSRGMTGLHLRGGSFASCPTRAIRAGASAIARDTIGGGRRVVRRLWGKDRHGRFRTHGRDSVATVRGTRWVTTDRCDGTLTRVKSGKVLVRDLRRQRSVLLTAGRAYLARHHQR